LFFHQPSVPNFERGDELDDVFPSWRYKLDFDHGIKLGRTSDVKPRTLFVLEYGVFKRKLRALSNRQPRVFFKLEHEVFKRKLRGISSVNVSRAYNLSPRALSHPKLRAASSLIHISLFKHGDHRRI